jgi:hypothetical protein
MLTSGDPGKELAAMVALHARDQKKLSQKIRNAEEKAQEDAEKAEIAAMREETEKKFQAAIVSGFMSMAAATTSFGAAGTQGADAARWKGGGQLLEAQSKMMVAGMDAEAGTAKTAARENEQIASRHKREAEEAGDSERDAQKMLDRALDFYKEYTQAKSDSQRAAIMRT